MRAAFLLSGYDGLAETLALLRGAGVERVVLLSSSAAPGDDVTNAVARYHILSERAVRESGLAWTFLQLNSFMTNTLRWVPQLRVGDVIRVPFADVAISTIDPAGIGAVAATAMVDDSLAGPACACPDRKRCCPPSRRRSSATRSGAACAWSRSRVRRRARR